jgi:hypothetical protein
MSSCMLASLVRDIEAGFLRLSHNILGNPADPGYTGAMRELINKVLVNSTKLCCYLTISETGRATSQVMIAHSIGKFSAGFGALSAFQGTIIMGLLGNMIGDNLPLFVQAPTRQGETRTWYWHLYYKQFGSPNGGGQIDDILHLGRRRNTSEEPNHNDDGKQGATIPSLPNSPCLGSIFSGLEESI